MPEILFISAFIKTVKLQLTAEFFMSSLVNGPGIGIRANQFSAFALVVQGAIEHGVYFLSYLFFIDGKKDFDAPVEIARHKV